MENLIVQRLKIKENFTVNVAEGFPQPKSVKGFIEFLLDSEKNFMEGKRVLELGCGYHASLAHYALFAKAISVDALDINPEAIDIVKKIGNNRINFIASDLFRNVQKKYDVILFNPPQMPKESRSLIDYHDSPGPTGLEIIERTLKECNSYLNVDGSIYMMVFDFLSSSDNLRIIAEENGMKLELLSDYERNIRAGGSTEENIPWIRHVYPNYEFKKNESGSFVRCNIVKFTYR